MLQWLMRKSYDVFVVIICETIFLTRYNELAEEAHDRSDSSSSSDSSDSDDDCCIM